MQSLDTQTNNREMQKKKMGRSTSDGYGNMFEIFFWGFTLFEEASVFFYIFIYLGRHSVMDR